MHKIDKNSKYYLTGIGYNKLANAFKEEEIESIKNLMGYKFQLIDIDRTVEFDLRYNENLIIEQTNGLFEDLHKYQYVYFIQDTKTKVIYVIEMLS